MWREGRSCRQEMDGAGEAESLEGPSVPTPQRQAVRNQGSKNSYSNHPVISP